MVVTEVEVLEAGIVDPELARLMTRVQSEFVTLQIGDRQAQEALASARLRADLERQRAELAAGAGRRDAEFAEAARRVAHGTALAKARDEEELAKEQQALADAREAATLAARMERDALARVAARGELAKDADARAAARRVEDEAALVAQAKLRELELRLLEAQSAATVAERQAVQAGLVEALTALGDKALLAEAASNMNLVSLFKGKEVGTLLAEVLGGTPAMPMVQALRERFAAAPASPTSAPAAQLGAAPVKTQ